MVREYANRFRLDKIDPGAQRSRVKKPIIFYVDRNAPEPIRSALIEGIGWWGKAFDAAGYIDAFQVKLLPKDIDPMDVRYNVVNWVDRATRGWSYGQEIVDPRTGEIVKGMVVLGSLRHARTSRFSRGLSALIVSTEAARMIRCRWRWRGFASSGPMRSVTRWA